MTRKDQITDIVLQDGTLNALGVFNVTPENFSVLNSLEQR